MKVRQGLVPLALLLFAAPSQSAIITFTSSAAFFGALSSFTTESFEADPPNTVIPDGLYRGLTYAFPAGKDGRIDNTFNRIGASSLAATPAGSFFFPGESVTVTFPTAITAVGIFFNIGTSPAGSLTVTTPVGVAGNGASPDISTLYFVGLTSDTPFNTATFGSTAPGLGFNLDELTSGQAVPEPADWTAGDPGLGRPASSPSRNATIGETEITSEHCPAPDTRLRILPPRTCKSETSNHVTLTRS